MIKRRLYIFLSTTVILFLLTGIYFLRPHSRFLLTVLPPSGLYNYIEKHHITIKKKGVLKEFSFKNDYVGTYFVGVLMNKPPDYGHPIVSKAKIKLSIMHNKIILYEMIFGRWSNRFGRPGKKEAGIILGYYMVPEDIPLKLHMNAHISIVSPDPKFEDRYGKLDFFIRRSVDQ